jgi:hypothetical protein
MNVLLLPAWMAPPLAQVTAEPVRAPAEPMGLELDLAYVTSPGSMMATALL